MIRHNVQPCASYLTFACILKISYVISPIVRNHTHICTYYGHYRHSRRTYIFAPLSLAVRTRWLAAGSLFPYFFNSRNVRYWAPFSLAPLSRRSQHTPTVSYVPYRYASSPISFLLLCAPLMHLLPNLKSILARSPPHPSWPVLSSEPRGGRQNYTMLDSSTQYAKIISPCSHIVLPPFPTICHLDNWICVVSVILCCTSYSVVPFAPASLIPAISLLLVSLLAYFCPSNRSCRVLALPPVSCRRVALSLPILVVWPCLDFQASRLLGFL